MEGGNAVNNNVIAQFEGKFDVMSFLQIYGANPNAEPEQLVFLCVAELVQEIEKGVSHALQLRDDLENRKGPRIRKRDARKEVGFALDVVHQLASQLNAFIQFGLALPNSPLSRGSFSAFRFLVSSAVQVRAADELRSAGLWAAGEVVFGAVPVADVAEVRAECRRRKIRVL